MPSTLCVRLGRRIRRLRSARGWSQADLAAYSGLSRAHLSNLENGRKEAGVKALGKLAKAFDRTISKLMQGL